MKIAKYHLLFKTSRNERKLFVPKTLISNNLIFQYEPVKYKILHLQLFSKYE